MPFDVLDSIGIRVASFPEAQRVTDTFVGFRNQGGKWFDRRSRQINGLGLWYK